MKINSISFFSGFLFSIGLILAGMTNPHKILGFLDFFGVWDPSLIFVMIGAISIHSVFYRFISKKKTPVFEKEWHIPKNKNITVNLIFGSTLFGIGWGLAGYCPGPALISLAQPNKSVVLFALSLISGMAVFYFLDKKFKFKR